MKKFLLSLSIIASFNSYTYSQQLYDNSTQTGSRFNPGKGQSGTPKVGFDDVNVSSTLVNGTDSINIKKIKIGIRQISAASATSVKIYYSVVDDTATLIGNLIKIPPVLLGTVSLPANTTGANVLSIVSLGDSINTLFSVKTDTGNLISGYSSFFIGVALTNDDPLNGIRLTSGPDANVNTMWIYNSDSTVPRIASGFAAPTLATFYIQVYGSTTTLPIKLSKFGGERNGALNNLFWTTQSEQNNKGFELQRSSDGVKFSKIAFVNTKSTDGNSASAINYQFIDENPLTGNNYYRLKQTDNDGKYEISKIVFVKGTKLSALTISTIYPNPVKSTLNVALSAPGEEKVSFTISDVSGKVLLQQSRKINSTESGNYSLNVSSLSKGIYSLKVTGASNNESTVTKFIKQ